MPRGVEDIQVRDRPLAGRIKLQVVAVHRAGGLPAETDFVELRRRDFSEIEASLDRQTRKARVMLEARDAFLGDGKEETAIAYDACGGIMHLGVVDAES